MIARKDAIVTKLTGGIAFLFQKNKVASLHGKGSFKGKNGDAYQSKSITKAKKPLSKPNTSS